MTERLVKCKKYFHINKLFLIFFQIYLIFVICVTLCRVFRPISEFAIHDRS